MLTKGNVNAEAVTHIESSNVLGLVSIAKYIKLVMWVIYIAGFFT